MNGDTPTRLQMIYVFLHRLDGEEMNRDRIRVECVDDEKIEAIRRAFNQFATVANLDTNVGVRLLEIREQRVVLSDIHYKGVDLEVGDRLT